MKKLKFKLNHQGQFQHEQLSAPLGHPIYQVIDIADEASRDMVLSELNSSILSDTGHTFSWQSLGVGRIVRSVREEPKFDLHFGMTTKPFHGDEERKQEVIRILKTVISEVEANWADGCPIMDASGNKVGEWEGDLGPQNLESEEGE